MMQETFQLLNKSSLCFGTNEGSIPEDDHQNAIIIIRLICNIPEKLFIQ